MFEYALTFTILTIFTMILHFWSDIRELKVDSRRNWMMIGVTLAIGLISNQTFVLIVSGFFTIFFMVLLGWLEKKQGKIVFGDGDKEIIGWSVPGIALAFGWDYTILFVGLLGLAFFIIAFARQKMLLSEKRLPGLTILNLIYFIIIILAWLL